MPVSTEKDFQSKIEKLENWLASKEGPLKLTPHESSMASGFSNETFVFDLEKKNSVETLVLRLEPTEYQVFPNYDLPMQASIMKVLRGKNMLTPEVIYENYDDNILGSGFYIMRSINGSAPSDNPPYHMDMEGMMGRATPTERHKVWVEWLDHLSRFHNLEFSSDELRDCKINKEEDPLGMHLDYYQSFLNWGMEGEPHEICSNALDWLVKNKPPLQKQTLCWGDARPGNVLYENFSAKALLDWEMANFGDPLMDLAWGFAIDDANSLALNVPKLEGTMDEEEGRTIWENKTGLSSEFFAYYRILALFKFSVIMVRVAKRLIFNEIMPLDSDFHVNNHVVAFLDKELNENN